MNAKIQRMTTLAVLSAIAYLVMTMLRIKFIPGADFLTLDVKDVVIVTGGFFYGPLASMMMSLVISFLEMVTVSSTGWWGMLMNTLSSCAFACSAAFLYERKRTIHNAVTGLVTGWLLATATMLLLNYIITPIYTGWPRQAVVGKMLPWFLPFNLIKYGVNAAVALLIYKPLVTALRRAHLLPTPDVHAGSGKINRGVMLAAALSLVTLALIILAYKGVI
ncbi:MAG: ECF transporter S component [Firmicutes bacterium]|nr:ECF transporter S component [Bacillota bacterium]